MELKKRKCEIKCVKNVKRAGFSFYKSLIFNIKTYYNHQISNLMVAIFSSFNYYKNFKKENFYGIN